MRRRRRAREGQEKRIREKQATDFEDAVCCSTAVVQGAAQRKNEGECLG